MRMESIPPNALVYLTGKLAGESKCCLQLKKVKGDNISKTDPVRYNWYQTITDRDQLSEIDTTIYYCTPQIAPKRRSSGTQNILIPSCGHWLTTAPLPLNRSNETLQANGQFLPFRLGRAPPEN